MDNLRVTDEVGFAELIDKIAQKYRTHGVKRTCDSPNHNPENKDFIIRYDNNYRYRTTFNETHSAELNSFTHDVCDECIKDMTETQLGKDLVEELIEKELLNEESPIRKVLYMLYATEELNKRVAMANYDVTEKVFEELENEL